MIGKSKQTTAAGRSALTVIIAIAAVAAATAGTPDTRWYTGNTGAETFNISTADQLAGLAQLVNSGNDFSGKTVRLTADVDLSEYGKGKAFNGGKGWVPIGKGKKNDYEDKPCFAGDFYGNGKKIRGLYINDASLPNAGLFGYLAGTAKNVGVVDVDITGGDNVGGLAGRTGAYSMINCHSTGSVRGNHQVGGLAGYFSYYGSTGDTVIANCYSAATVRGIQSVGGLVGSIMSGMITGCYSTGAVSGDVYVGGIAGSISTAGWEQSHSIVTFCYSTGIVTGQNLVGGVAGSVDGPGTVGNSYSTGAVKGSEGVGGVVGGLVGSDIDNCYSTSAIEGDKSVGGIVGIVENGHMPCRRHCGDDEVISVGSSVTSSAALNPSVKCKGAAGRVVGKTKSAEMSNNTAFTGLKDRLDRTNRWVMNKANAGDGADITAEKIAADGTIGGRFKGGEWTTQNGKLPGLGGKAVEMPEHLK